jgi:hypothetical protein
MLYCCNLVGQGIISEHRRGKPGLEHRVSNDTSFFASAAVGYSKPTYEVEGEPWCLFSLEQMQSLITAVNHRYDHQHRTKGWITMETHTRRGKGSMLNTGTFLFLSRFRLQSPRNDFCLFSLYSSRQLTIVDRHSRQIIHQIKERKRVLTYGDDFKISNTHYRRSGTIERAEQNTTFSQNWARLTRLLSFDDL